MSNLPANQSQPPLSVGDQVVVRLDAMAAGGDAVGRHHGFAVFASLGAPGDLARMRVEQVARNYARGTVEAVIEPGPGRVAPPCPYFGACGGCQWQHLGYGEQLRAKESMLRESLARLAALRAEDNLPSAPMAEPWRYRAAAEFSVAPGDPPALGFVRARSHQVLPIADCLVQHPLNLEVMRAVNRWLAEHGAGALHGVRSRASFADERAVVTLVYRARDDAARPTAEHLLAAAPQVAGVCAVVARDRRQHRRLSQPLVGEPWIEETVGAQRYRVSADSFFQVNPAQAARMVQVVERWAQVQGEAVVDGYCGVGLFLLPLAQRAQAALGIESNPAAVADARFNLRQADLGWVRVLRERMDRALPLLARGRAPGEQTARLTGARRAVIVLDPPRQGCGREVIAAAAALGARAVVMVSCDPATLARDLALLAAHGYRPRRSAIVDMFPHTWQVESLTLCER